VSLFKDTGQRRHQYAPVLSPTGSEKEKSTDSAELTSENENRKSAIRYNSERVIVNSPPDFSGGSSLKICRIIFSSSKHRQKTAFVLCVGLIEATIWPVQTGGKLFYGFYVPCSLGALVLAPNKLCFLSRICGSEWSHARNILVGKALHHWTALNTALLTPQGGRRAVARLSRPKLALPRLELPDRDGNSSIPLRGPRPLSGHSWPARRLARRRD